VDVFAHPALHTGVVVLVVEVVLVVLVVVSDVEVEVVPKIINQKKIYLATFFCLLDVKLVDGVTKYKRII
jgi:hypothetical protein